MKRIFISGAFLTKFLIFDIALTTCASTTGIVPTGKDTFVIFRKDISPAALRDTITANTFKEAGAYCAGKNVKAISETDTPRSFGQFPQSTPHFTCV